MDPSYQSYFTGAVCGLLRDVNEYTNRDSKGKKRVNTYPGLKSSPITNTTRGDIYRKLGSTSKSKVDDKSIVDTGTTHDMEPNCKYFLLYNCASNGDFTTLGNVAQGKNQDTGPY